MPELTDQQWEDIQRTLGPVKANAWLAKRNRALAAELPPINPTQPSVYQTQQASPQGTAPMPNPPSGALPSAPQGTAQAPTPAPGALPTIADLLAEQNTISADTLKFIERVRNERKKNYDLETEELKNRRFGPSRAEELFALAAAVGKPTYDRSFGSIMANVTPALAAMEASKRNADIQRAEAARALRQKYLSDLDETELAVLGERRKAADARVPIITAMTKPRTPVAKVYTDALGVTRHKIYGSKIVEPPIDKINALKSYLANPNNTEQDKLITAKNFDAAYGYGATDIYGGE